MAEKKKRRLKCEEPCNKLSKEQDAIARFLRFNCPVNSTTFEGNEVHYFTAKKAIDLLIESKQYGAKAKDSKFQNNVSAEEFLRTLLEKGLFFRARKVVLKKKEKTKLDTDKKKDGSNDSPKTPKIKKKHETNSSVNKNSIETLENTEDEKITDQEDERKRKKKVKLLFHDVQTFSLDPGDVYVWVFDPTPFYKKVIGLLIVLGTIAGCLFPLWPDWLRLVIYYLSITGIALFGLLLGVALARTILFGIIWALTFGRHKLWILPNLTEDCGFFDSFKPFYTYEYVHGSALCNNNNADDVSNENKKKMKKSEKKEIVEKIELNKENTESDLFKLNDSETSKEKFNEIEVDCSVVQRKNVLKPLKSDTPEDDFVIVDNN